jgi:hypothetical protein
MFDDEGAEFVGVLSEQNNGGFSSVRADGPFDLAGARGLELSFMGDGQIYKLQVSAAPAGRRRRRRRRAPRAAAEPLYDPDPGRRGGARNFVPGRLPHRAWRLGG